MEKAEIYDYIIVGAGILGCATAKYLQDEIGNNKKILLIDKYMSCGQGNTSKSNACYRNVFDTELNIKLCNSSICYYTHVEKDLGFDLGIKEFGYLWLLTEEQMNVRKEKTIFDTSGNASLSFLDFLDLQKVSYEVLSKEQLKDIFPGLQLEGLVEGEKVSIQSGLLGVHCGSLVPDLLVKFYEEQYRKKGGVINYGWEVTDILLQEKGKSFDKDYFPTVWRNTEIAGIKVKNVKSLEEQILLSKHVVLCTGAWVNQLIYNLGIHVGVNAKKRQLFRIKGKQNFVINSAFKNKYASIPFIILPSGGVFIKPIPQNGCVDVGCSDDIGRQFETEPKLMEQKYDSFKNNLDNPRGELEFYQTDVLPVLKAYFPNEFNEKVLIEQPSAGMYAYSLDKFPVIAKEHNLFICTGASGSGIMKGDAIARINVANIVGKDTCELFDGSLIVVKDFSIHQRKVPDETLIL